MARKYHVSEAVDRAYWPSRPSATLNNSMVRHNTFSGPALGCLPSIANANVEHPRNYRRCYNMGMRRAGKKMSGIEYSLT